MVVDHLEFAPLDLPLPELDPALRHAQGLLAALP